MKCSTRYCRRETRSRGKFCGRCAKRMWRACNPIKAILAQIRDRAARKKLEFDLDICWLEDFLERNNYDSSINHIDRKSYLGGYTKDNLQILSIEDNIAKGNRERHGQSQLF